MKLKKGDAQNIVFQQLKSRWEGERGRGRDREQGSHKQETVRQEGKVSGGGRGRVVERSKEQTLRKRGRGRNVSSCAAGQGLKLSSEKGSADGLTSYHWTLLQQKTPISQ